MNPISTTDVVLIIGVVTTSVVTIINALRITKTVNSTHGKLDHIVTLTNSTLTAAQMQISILESAVVKLTLERDRARAERDTHSQKR